MRTRRVTSAESATSRKYKRVHCLIFSLFPPGHPWNALKKSLFVLRGSAVDGAREVRLHRAFPTEMLLFHCDDYAETGVSEFSYLTRRHMYVSHMYITCKRYEQLRE